MRIFYDWSIWVLKTGIYLAAYFHPKAGAWVAGRRHWRKVYSSNFQKNGRVLWMHAASLGEFEQGRPILDAFREQRPDWQIVLTFFSPSGYTIRKNYPAADFVCYLPADTRRNARDFLDLIQPGAVIFIKYEFWANYLFELKGRNTPTLLVSALFRPSQPFFRWYGAFWRKILGCFSHFFVQNQISADLLAGLGLGNVTVAGDTRVDRVLALAESTPPPSPPPTGRGASSQDKICFEKIEAVGALLMKNKNAPLPKKDNWNEGKPPSPLGEGMGVGLIAGSTWPPDEKILLPLIKNPEFEHLRWVIAPHEPSEKHLAQLEPAITKPCVRYSKWDGSQAAKVMLIDSIGLLNSLYRYGWVAYIGGGFGKGIHNTLEPAAFGLPIIFGPAYEKFEEARQFVARGGAFPVRNQEEMAAVLRRLQNPEVYQKAAQAVQGYLQESRGATSLVLQYLDEQQF